MISDVIILVMAGIVLKLMPIITAFAIKDSLGFPNREITQFGIVLDRAVESQRENRPNHIQNYHKTVFQCSMISSFRMVKQLCLSLRKYHSIQERHVGKSGKIWLMMEC